MENKDQKKKPNNNDFLSELDKKIDSWVKEIETDKKISRISEILFEGKSNPPPKRNSSKTNEFNGKGR